jgi:hypothetical protein
MRRAYEAIEEPNEETVAAARERVLAVIEEAIGRERVAHRHLRSRRQRLLVFVTAALVVVVVTASAFGTVRDLFFVEATPYARGKLTRTVDGTRFSLIVPEEGWENGPHVHDGGKLSGKLRTGSMFISKSFNVIGQHAQAVIYWTAFPGGTEAVPCRNLLAQDIGGSTLELAAAMARAPGIRVVQHPARVFIDGHSATHVVLSVRKDRGCDPGHFFTWRPRSGAMCEGACWVRTGVGDTIRVWIVAVDGKRLVLTAETERPPPGLHPHALAEWTKAEREIARIVGSLRFE